MTTMAVLCYYLGYEFPAFRALFFAIVAFMGSLLYLMLLMMFVRPDLNNETQHASSETEKEINSQAESES